MGFAGGRTPVETKTEESHSEKAGPHQAADRTRSLL